MLEDFLFLFVPHCCHLLWRGNLFPGNVILIIITVSSLSWFSCFSNFLWTLRGKGMWRRREGDRQTDGKSVIKSLPGVWFLLHAFCLFKDFHKHVYVHPSYSYCIIWLKIKSRVFSFSLKKEVEKMNETTERKMIDTTGEINIDLREKELTKGRTCFFHHQKCHLHPEEKKRRGSE